MSGWESTGEEPDRRRKAPQPRRSPGPSGVPPGPEAGSGAGAIVATDEIAAQERLRIQRYALKTLIVQLRRFYEARPQTGEPAEYEDDLGIP